MTIKKVRTFITNGKGRWAEFPLTSEDKAEIQNHFDENYETLRVSPTLTYYLDDEFKRSIEVNVRDFTLDQMNELAEAIQYYTEKKRKNAYLKKMERFGDLKIGRN
ncbi:hypothetical protein [Paenibacillus sp. LK1]|uniref:hypothetical protein n=1 Tax=Paenibacillus sp. LK1 TaxID=2053014 RepID=UPI000C18BA26|nr:hypothetical protein [Paenibacillus sp. LK1]PIH59140.1 hypothetical protein CS562_14470 [Paenibacillus sp. LK1]